MPIHAVRPPACRAVHSSPQKPAGASTSNQNGALLYGVEYEAVRGTMRGNIDDMLDKDAACVVCEREDAVQTYVQWGRQTCSNGAADQVTKLQYKDPEEGGKCDHSCFADWPHKRDWIGNQVLRDLFDSKKGGKKDIPEEICKAVDDSKSGDDKYICQGCPECRSHNFEYSGVIMAAHYSHYKSEFVCMDYWAKPSRWSSDADDDGGRLCAPRGSEPRRLRDGACRCLALTLRVGGVPLAMHRCGQHRGRRQHPFAPR